MEMPTGRPRPRLDDDTRQRAIQAVNAALESFDRQSWYQTLWARLRFALYWMTYSLRRRMGRKGFF